MLDAYHNRGPYHNYLEPYSEKVRSDSKMELVGDVIYGSDRTPLEDLMFQNARLWPAREVGKFGHFQQCTKACVWKMFLLAGRARNFYLKLLKT